MAEVDGRAPRILLVDDRPENLLALEAILHGFGYDLAKANSGEEALKLLLTDDFALILLDVQMPGMDGFETATHIKQRERTREIPILFLTAIDSEAHQAYRGYAAGAVDYLSKPFDPWVLRAKVGVFIELFERRRQLSAQVDELRAQLDMHSSIPIAELAETAAIAVEEARRLCEDDRPAGPAIAHAVEAISLLRTALGRAVDGVSP
jgi:CheY-like chemotaxis protein